MRRGVFAARVAAFACVEVLARPIPGISAPSARLDFRSRSGRFEVYSRVGLGNEAERIADQAEAAYTWLETVQRWSERAVLDQPVRIVVDDLSSQGFLGATSPAGYLELDINHWTDDPQLAAGTLAHELCHLQDQREIAPGVQPPFIREGRGRTNGFMYRRHLGFPALRFDHLIADRITRMTTDQVTNALDFGGPRYRGNVEAMEEVGTWFVEFLRTRVAGGVDAQPRLAQTIVTVHTGVPFADAFNRSFGITLADALRIFTDFVDGTSGAGRLRGTIWDGLA